MARISVETSFCKGCGLCVDACPEQIMALDHDKITAKATTPRTAPTWTTCTGCMSCAVMCLT